MAKKKAAAGEPQVVTHPQVHAVTHTARMLAVLADENRARPASKKEYEYVIEGYRRQWRSYSPETRKMIKKVAAEIPDMTPKQVTAAIAALEE